MKLVKYLKVNGLTHKKFAEMIGVTRPLVTYIVNERKNPSINVIVRIEQVTEGKVTAKDLFNPEAPSRLKKRGKKE